LGIQGQTGAGHQPERQYQPAQPATSILSFKHFNLLSGRSQVTGGPSVNREGRNWRSEQQGTLVDEKRP
jgi:hypothetical protein